MKADVSTVNVGKTKRPATYRKTGLKTGKERKRKEKGKKRK